MNRIKYERKLTLATVFTLLRIVLTPFIVYAILSHWWYGAALLFVVAALTDVIDGFLARHYNQKTFLGACLDPVADKILLLSTFCALWLSNASFALIIPTWFIILLLCKEVLQIVGALLLFKKSGCRVIEAHFFGKVTTLMQIILIMLFFINTPLNIPLNLHLYKIVLFGTILLLVVSFIYYSVVWFKKMHEGHNP